MKFIETIFPPYFTRVNINPNNYMLDLFVKIISTSLCANNILNNTVFSNVKRNSNEIDPTIISSEREGKGNFEISWVFHRKKNCYFRPTGQKKIRSSIQKMLDRAKGERVNGASWCRTRVSTPQVYPSGNDRNNEGRSLFGFAFLY